jgi:hypothetical protein
MFYIVSQLTEETGENLELNGQNVLAQRMFYLILK